MLCLSILCLPKLRPPQQAFQRSSRSHEEHLRPQSSDNVSESVRIDRGLARIRRTLAGRLRELLAGGDANPDLDQEDEAAALASFIDGLGLHALISPEAFTPAKRRSLLEGFCSRWRAGAKKRSARHA
ncbi:TetR family transcriptional regulator C-terminal domain-containing protein [Bradyrhizobium sp. USDA 3240]